MTAVKQQSEESKFIKRINEQLADVSKITGFELDNPLISKWSRAIRESGLEFTKDSGTNRYRLKNNAENRAKAADLQKSLAKYNPTTAGEYRAKVKNELVTEAEKLTKGMKKSEAKKFTREYASKSAVQKRIEIHSMDGKIQSMLELIYNQTGSHELGDKLSQLTQGKTYGERDSAAVYNVFGQISDEFRRVQQGLLTDEEEQRLIDREQMLNDYAFFDDDEDF